MGRKRKHPQKFSKNFFLDTLIKIFVLLWLALKYIVIGLYLALKYSIIGLIKALTWVYRKINDTYRAWAKKKKDKELWEDDTEEKVTELNHDSNMKEKKKKTKPFKNLETLEGELSKFELLLKDNKSTIGIILGARGKGKSALGMRLLEFVHEYGDKRCVAMGFDKKKLPGWIHVIDDVENLPPNSVILIDEGGILFSSRDSMSNANKLLSSLLLVARHKDISVIFISQNSSNLELNAIRQADYMLLKPSSLLQKDFERQKIKQMYADVDDKFKEYDKHVGLTYVFSDKYRGFVTNGLPSFWNEDVSKAFKEK